MSASAGKYREFWAGKSSAMSRCQTPESLWLLGGELKLLLGRTQCERVLEIGCGNGTLFDLLDFPAESYRGVDFSARMLEQFRRRHPELDLVEAEGSSYADGHTYDLILLHDVIAHFTPAMLARHCRNAMGMMHMGSLLVWASVPWRIFRNSYDLGKWSSGQRADLGRWTKSWIRRLAGRDMNGRWYEVSTVGKIAEQNSLAARFHGSITHPYRFHAVLSPVFDMQEAHEMPPSLDAVEI